LPGQVAAGAAGGAEDLEVAGSEEAGEDSAVSAAVDLGVAAPAAVGDNPIRILFHKEAH